MSYRPRCFTMDCGHRSDTVLRLPTFGPVYFCAGHGLRNARLAPEGVLS